MTIRTTLAKLTAASMDKTLRSKNPLVDKLLKEPTSEEKLDQAECPYPSTTKYNRVQYTRTQFYRA